MEHYIATQVRFWYKNAYPYVVKGDWDYLLKKIQESDFAKQTVGFLTKNDTTPEAVAAKYTIGEYRFRHNAEVVRDVVQHDVHNRLSDDHILPILMVDCLGPGVAFIGYNRTTGDDNITTLWPLPYHLHIAVAGFTIDNIPFTLKKDVVIFRGALSGELEHKSIGRTMKASRLRVVYDWINRTNNDCKWCDLGITTLPAQWTHKKEYTLECDTTCKACMKPIIPLKDMLSLYKYVLCLEGADISSGFGAVLASNAIPFHPYPFVYEVWYFNGLQPFEHFIPLKYDCSDLYEMYQWCQSNPTKCEEISQNGKLHMERMCDADNLKKIKDGVVALWNMKNEQNTI